MTQTEENIKDIAKEITNYKDKNIPKSQRDKVDNRRQQYQARRRFISEKKTLQKPHTSK